VKYPGNIKPLHGGINAAPFIGVLFLMVPMLMFHTSLVFKPGVEVDLSLPVSAQKTGVTDPSLSIAVDASGVLYFQGKQVMPQVFSEKVKEEDEGTPLVDLVINRVEELDSNLLIRLVVQGRVLLNGEPAEAETQLKAGHQIELDVPATELLRRRVEQEIERGALESEKISLLVQADKAVRHETIVDLCAMAGEVGVGRVLLATRPTDFSRPPEPEN
tara:strand:+ start:962 stop:1612 length:651 start_codon:yes stop_codon:yes gene_type:complete